MTMMMRPRKRDHLTMMPVCNASQTVSAVFGKQQLE